MHEPVIECMRLWAADMNIGYVLTEEQLQHYFSCFGTVLDVYLPRCAQTGTADDVMPASSSASPPASSLLNVYSHSGVSDVCPAKQCSCRRSACMRGSMPLKQGSTCLEAMYYRHAQHTGSDTCCMR